MSIRAAMLEATGDPALVQSGGGRPLSIRAAMLQATGNLALVQSGGGRP